MATTAPQMGRRPFLELQVACLLAACLLASTNGPHGVAARPRPGQSNSTYFAKRREFLSRESDRVLGAGLVLTDAEMAVNKTLLSLKLPEFEEGLLKSTFPPTVNFLTGKPLVEKSKVLSFIKRMPKGGLLHLHEISLANATWVVTNVTYLPNLYFCVLGDYYSSLHFKFSTTQPRVRPPECVTDWRLVSSARAEVGAAEFDHLLYRNLTMVSPDPDQAYPNSTMAWMRFQQALTALTDLFFYAETLPLFLRQCFQEMMADNVQYIEIRTLLLPLLSANGTTYSREYTLKQFIKAIEDFRAEYPKDFVGAKIIYTSIRFPENKTKIAEEVKQAMVFRRAYTQYFAGYDLVSREDAGGPLKDYIPELLYPSQHGFDLPFFFHAGETNWEGTTIDENLIDAVLLNTSRIGHGYALPKHPCVLEAVKARNIAVEVNPISNQILHLVHDMRDHMGAHLIADSYPVVVSSDDPALWGALPLSHDFYMAFMGMSGKNVGLTFLKQLILNSFKYSAMTDTEQKAARNLWQAKWDNFIKEILVEYG